MRYVLLTLLLFFAMPLRAETVVLMIADGMGFQHLACARQDGPLFMETAPITGLIKTASADNAVTDSGAAATAFACGLKTKNDSLGVDVGGKPCRSLAEEFSDRGYFVGIRSTDEETGATPAAFFAHTTNRHDKQVVEKALKKARKGMDLKLQVDSLATETERLLSKSRTHKKEAFIILEAAYVDKKSHDGDLAGMKQALRDFDAAVAHAVRFAKERGDVTVVVTADHETGGLDDACAFTVNKHTGADVPLFAFGNGAYLFAGPQENTALYAKIAQLLVRREKR